MPMLKGWRAWAPIVSVLVTLVGCGGSGSEVTVETITDEERARRMENLPPQQRALIESMNAQKTDQSQTAPAPSESK